MATLSALKFETADGAEGALDLVKSLQKQQLITLEDAAIVTWPEGAKKPKTKQLINLAGIGAMNGAFWGMLFKKTKEKVTEGTSALFLLTSDATTDKVIDQMKQLDFEIISTSLSQEEEDKLREAFSEE